tara:strand:+ start:400 stop:708 length:309 start_codon:yes stop_codon:yes gene_type:complete
MKISSAAARKKERELLSKENMKRSLNRNHKAMSFCIKNGLIIYPLLMKGSSTHIKLIVERKGQKRKLNNKTYNQTQKKEVVDYTADIDREYERIYFKMKDNI